MRHTNTYVFNFFKNKNNTFGLIWIPFCGPLHMESKKAKYTATYIKILLAGIIRTGTRYAKFLINMSESIYFK